MSCRSSFGGRAACMHATMCGIPSAEQSRLLHAMQRSYRENAGDGGEPAALADVEDYLDRLETHARHLPGVSDTRRARLAAAISAARSEARGGSLPSRATLAAWESLPAMAPPPASAQPATSSTPRGGARPYHKRFTSFDQRTLDATDALFAARPSQMSPAERDVAFRQWVSTVSAVYDMEEPSFSWDTEADSGGGGYYRLADHSITMSPNHPSITTLIHEFRHALQHKEKGAPMVDRDVEVDARAWSLSLYHRVRPRLFERLVREGRIFHITPDDLDR